MTEPPHYASATLPPWQQVPLVNALLDIGALQDDAGRDTFATTIGQILGHPLLVRTDQGSRTFLTEVAQASTQTAEGRHALVQVVDFMAGTSEPAARIRSLIDHLPALAAQELPILMAPARSSGRSVRTFLHLAVAPLPAADRARYREEWIGLLTELPTRRSRARQLISLPRGSLRLAWTLRRPPTGRRPA